MLTSYRTWALLSSQYTDHFNDATDAPTSHCAEHICVVTFYITTRFTQTLHYGFKPGLNLCWPEGMQKILLWHIDWLVSIVFEFRTISSMFSITFLVSRNTIVGILVQCCSFTQEFVEQNYLSGPLQPTWSGQALAGRIDAVLVPVASCRGRGSSARMRWASWCWLGGERRRLAQPTMAWQTNWIV